MKSKSLLIINIFLVLALFLVGCGPKPSPRPDPDPAPVSDETKIRSQMAKWAEVWETQNTDNFRTTMVDNGISFTFTDEVDESELTIDEFIDLAECLEFWGLPISSRINIDSITIDGISGTTKGEWIIGDTRGGLNCKIEATLLKDSERWLISSLVIPFYQEYYEGEENEEYNPDKHLAYVSLNVDGKAYIFHDQYGGNEREMVNFDPEGLFRITAFKEDSNEGIVLKFVFDGEGGIPEFADATWDDGEVLYSYPQSDFVATMDTHDFDGGSVHGTFSGHLNNEEGVSVEITGGKFHFNHEFNPPVVTIESPGEGAEVYGKVKITGTWDDESELAHVWVSIDSCEGWGETVYEGPATIDINSWSFSFDSNKMGNGDYLITVYARDKYWNSSDDVERRIVINNN